VSRETNLRKSWPQGGPPLVWSISNLGLGYSGPAIVGNRLYVSVGNAKRVKCDFYLARFRFLGRPASR
jgi:hypothetical protein